MSELRYVCKTCGKVYKLLTWFNKHVEKYQHELDPIELFDKNNELSFLKCEINMLKRQYRELKAKGFMSSMDPIERIGEDQHRPEREPFKVEFNVIIQELKI